MMTGFGSLVLRMVVAFVVATLSASSSSAQLANRKDTLQGHRSVFVSVTTPATDDATRDLGLIKGSLERYVLDQLTKAGIPAATAFTDQTLVLEINVDLHRVVQSGDVTVFAFVSQFEALQAAKLATNRQSALVATWKAVQFGAVTKAESHRLRDSVTTNLDQFIKDWQAVQAAPPADRSP